jgi:hypothetical protein
MQRTFVTSTLVVVAMLAATTMKPLNAGPTHEAKLSGPQAPRAARLTLQDGRCRLVAVEGVGCSEAICSRIAIRSRAITDHSLSETHFDTLSAVNGLTQNGALFVMKDGSSRQVSVPWDNRVLYVVDSNGVRNKVLLSDVVALDFLPMDHE